MHTAEREPAAAPIGRWGKVWRVAFVAGMGLVGWLSMAIGLPDDVTTWTLWRAWALEPVLGVLAGVLALYRRRRPVAIGALTSVLAAISPACGGAGVLVLASVATRRRWRELLVVGTLSFASGLVENQVYPRPPDQPRTSLVALIVTAAVMTSLVVAIGYAVGSRRELARERVEAAERAQEVRIAQAATGERTRIAREMHDVLAHRISLVAMHAGALNYRTDLTPEQMSEALKTIETNAHQALADLREVLGVLREPRDQDAPIAIEPPQPGLASIPGLVAEVTASGMRVTLEDATTAEAPAGTGRTAYRVVQEALTNARKHAPGAAVQVRLSGAPHAGLQVEVHNLRSLQAVITAMPESGLGLLGLQERVALAGGRLRHGRDPDGGYTVHAWLPWPA